MAYKKRRIQRKAYKNVNKAAYYGYGAYKAVKYGAKALPIVAGAVKYIGGLVNVEKHQRLVNITGSLTNAGVVHLLSPISQGDDIGSRQGNSVKSVDLMCSYNLQQGTAANNVARVIIFIDTANQGSNPAVTDVLTSATITSQRNIDNMKRFKILYDKMHSFDTDTTTISRKYYRKLGHHIRYSSSSETATLQNNIFLLILDSNGTNHATLLWDSKLSFYDN